MMTATDTKTYNPPFAIETALTHRAKALLRLESLLQERLMVLRKALLRSAAKAQAASLLLRLDEIEKGLLSQKEPPGGSTYLVVCRKLGDLETALVLAESTLVETERKARTALTKALSRLTQVVPELALSKEALLALSAEVPLDPGMSERLQALVALIEARRDCVPRLAAARPKWKRA